MKWIEQFEIIKKKTAEIFAKQGKNFSLSNLDIFLDVTRGKSRAWARGQRPSANDLQKIAKKLDLSAEWLLLGKGDPEAKSSYKEPQSSSSEQTFVHELKKLNKVLKDLGATKEERKFALLNLVKKSKIDTILRFHN